MSPAVRRQRPRRIVSRPGRRRPLYLSRDAYFDYFTAIEWGRGEERQPRGRWVQVSEQFRLLLDRPEGCVVGFRIDDFSEWGPGGEDEEMIKRAGRLDAPVLALRGAGPIRIAVQAGRFFGGENSLNRDFFDR